MKKLLITILTIIMIFTLTACEDNTSNIEPVKENTVVPQEEKKEEKNTSESVNTNAGENKSTNTSTNTNTYVEDDLIIEFEDEDNEPYKEEERVVVEKVINCDGCVYAYFSDEGDKAKRIGSTLSKSEYTTDINEIRTKGNKQRHNFFGLVLSGDKISKAYACILKDNKIYCIQGSVDGAYHTNNIGILNQIFTADQCKYISNGHTYTCTDGSYNGTTITTGYTCLLYETGCTIYGSDSNTGKLICH